MKLGSNVAPHASDIVAKFHCSGFDNFWAALDARLIFAMLHATSPANAPLHSRHTKTTPANNTKLAASVAPTRAKMPSKFG
jgi:hypothetical protein